MKKVCAQRIQVEHHEYSYNQSRIQHIGVLGSS
jgi:hypothetical protein